MKRIGALLLGLAVGGIVNADCDNPDLVVAERASGIQYRGCWQVQYAVDEVFPAADLIAELNDRIAARGWNRLNSDPLEPSATEHVVHAWTKYSAEDESQTEIDQWLGWFVRKDGSRLQLDLRYFGRLASEGDTRPAIVTVTYVTERQWQARPK